MLQQYRKKRDFEKTPEPKAKVPKSRAAGKLVFVIQKHAARRLHYDFRLEAGGVLLSWAVPKGPSLNPTERRLAMHVEDHPFDYKDFEGIIPAKQYGAGEVIVWDNGTYAPVDENGPITDRKAAEAAVKKGMQKGKLTIVMYGTKMHGEWTLVKTNGKERDQWLLIKHKDEFADSDADLTKLTHSVQSGQTLDDLQTDEAHKLAAKKAPARTAISRPKPPEVGVAAPFPKNVTPMLASLSDEPFSKTGWMYEPKLDGIRAIAYIRKGKVKLESRRGLDLSHRFPGIVDALSEYPFDLVLDGEIAALDEKGRPSFQLLQNQAGSIVYYAFDIIHYRGRSLLGVRLDDRKALLEEILVPQPNIKFVSALDTDGINAFDVCIKNGLEGIVAKKFDSLYEAGRRSANWLKVKGTQTAEFVICGYTEGTGSRGTVFGSLLLGYYNDTGKLVYAGNVGTGFNDKLLNDLMRKMKPLETDESPFAAKIKGRPSATWLKPKLVAEVKFAEWTADQMLRVPVFLRLRPDATPSQTGPNPIVHVNSTSTSTSKDLAKTPVLDKSMQKILDQLDNKNDKVGLELEGHILGLTSLNKELWPGTSESPPVTKRDYVIYLARIAPYMLPHLKDRPITMIRFPNGIYGQKFFQKHWDQKMPKFVETVKYFSDHNEGDVDYLLCNNLSTLLWFGQMASLELHTTHSRIDPKPDATWLTGKLTGSLENVENSVLHYPDFLVLDLDPYLYSGKEEKGAEPELHKKGFRKTAKIALVLKGILDDMEIKSYIKTSGKTGLHIYIPMIRNVDYGSVKDIAEAIGMYLLQQNPEEVTMQWAVVKRTGKVFFDHNMNARTKTLASPYSTRNSPEAAVSLPIEWDELKSIYPTDFTVYTVPERMAKTGDIWKDILNNKNDLHKLAEGKQQKRKR